MWMTKTYIYIKNIFSIKWNHKDKPVTKQQERYISSYAFTCFLLTHSHASTVKWSCLAAAKKKEKKNELKQLFYRHSCGQVQIDVFCKRSLCV